MVELEFRIWLLLVIFVTPVKEISEKETFKNLEASTFSLEGLVGEDCESEEMSITEGGRTSVSVDSVVEVFMLDEVDFLDGEGWEGGVTDKFKDSFCRGVDVDFGGDEKISLTEEKDLRELLTSSLETYI